MKPTPQLELGMPDAMPREIETDGLGKTVADIKARGGHPWAWSVVTGSKSRWLVEIVWPTMGLMTWTEALARLDKVTVNPTESAVLSMKLAGR